MSGRVRTSLRARVVAGALARPVQSGTVGGLMQSAVDEVDAMDAWLARFLPARRAASIAPLIVLAAIAHAAGSHEHREVTRHPDGTLAVTTPGPAHPWTAAASTASETSSSSAQRRPL